MAKVETITVPVDVELSDKLKALIAAEVARQLQAAKDELVDAVEKRIVTHMHLQSGMRK